LHFPVVPQVFESVALQMPCGSAALSTGEQVPNFPFRLQALQAPVHAVLQQTPCAQWPEPHSLSAEQSLPMGPGPHELLLHEFGATHWLSFVQAVAHLDPLHMLGAHVRELPATHWCEPLHLEGSVYALFLQLSGPHSVPVAYFWHAPLPSQRPLVSQLLAPLSLQVLRGSALPAGMFVHVPALSAELHWRHPPWQDEVQQTPSTQKPESHSMASVHLTPGPFLPQSPIVMLPTVVCLQGCPAWQSLSALHEVPQAPFVHRNGAHS
jgi:hypothetical protein